VVSEVDVRGVIFALSKLVQGGHFWVSTITRFISPPPFEGLYLITRKDLVDGCEAEMGIVLAV
jgi:hypothetical protein